MDDRTIAFPLIRLIDILGRHIVDFLEETLETNIYKELMEPDDASVLDRIGRYKCSDNINKSLYRAFLITDAMSRKDNITTSGATAVAALIRRTSEGKFLYVANVGDSRAVLCTSVDQNKFESTYFSFNFFRSPAQTECGYVAQRLSHDHTADDPGEQQRIQAAGGFIARGRVLGILAVSRSFGDHGMKDYVIAMPHLTEVNLSDHGSCPFLILACDGLWDVITDQEAIEIVLQETQKNNGPVEGIAEVLVGKRLSSP